MFARVTALEIDPVRIDIDDAVAMYKHEVAPVLREQEGYAGGYVLTTPEGKALLMTLWETEEQAEAHSTRSLYAEHLARFATLFRAPPGRDRYLVAFEDASALAAV